MTTENANQVIITRSEPTPAHDYSIKIPSYNTILLWRPKSACFQGKVWRPWVNENEHVWVLLRNGDIVEDKAQYFAWVWDDRNPVVDDDEDLMDTAWHQNIVACWRALI